MDTISPLLDKSSHENHIPESKYTGIVGFEHTKSQFVAILGDAPFFHHLAPAAVEAGEHLNNFSHLVILMAFGQQPSLGVSVKRKYAVGGKLNYTLVLRNSFAGHKVPTGDSRKVLPGHF